MFELLSERFIYIPIIILLMTGLYVVVATGNLVKRLVGLSLFQTSVCLMYIAIGKVFGGTPPILADTHGEDAGHGPDPAASVVAGHRASDDHAEIATDTGAHAADTVATAHEPVAAAAAEYGVQLVEHATELAHHAAIYSNPLPHVLILTAIVVGVATLAVGLALVVRIQEAYGSIEDDDLNSADYAVETGGAE